MSSGNSASSSLELSAIEGVSDPDDSGSLVILLFRHCRQRVPNHLTHDLSWVSPSLRRDLDYLCEVIKIRPVCRMAF